MGYPHFSGDCVDFHDRVIDWGSHGRKDNVVKPAGVITLCGSTRFMDEFLAEQRRLTMEGFIVISVGLFGHMENTYVPASLDLGTDEQPSELKLMLDNLHFRKIDLANRVHVINKDGYIGTSTRNEIHYAHWAGKDISFMDPSETIDMRWFDHDFEERGGGCKWFGCGAWAPVTV